MTGEATVLGARVSDPAAEDAALTRVVELVVPRLAELCSVHLFDEDGAVRCAVTASADGVEDVITRQMTALLRARCDWASLERAMAARSVVFVPLAIDGRTEGVMTAATVHSNRRLGSGDLAFLRELGHQAGLALENVRLRATLERVRAVVKSAEHDIRNPLAVITMHAELSQLRAATLGAPDAVELDAAMTRILMAVATAHQLVAELSTRCQAVAERPT